MRNFQFLCGQHFFFLSCFLGVGSSISCSYLAAVGEYLVTQLSHTHALALLGQHKHTHTHTLSAVAVFGFAVFFLVGDFFCFIFKN